MSRKYFDYTVKVMKDAVLETGRVATWANEQESKLLSVVAAVTVPDQGEQSNVDAQVFAVWEEATRKISGALEEMSGNMQGVDVASDPFGDLENRIAGSNHNPWMAKFGIASFQAPDTDDGVNKTFPQGSWKAMWMANPQISEMERTQIEQIKQLHTLVECHAGDIVAAGIDAFQAFGIAAVLAGGGRVHAFGDGFVEVQNGIGEIVTFRRGDDVYQSNPASDAGPARDSPAFPHGGQAGLDQSEMSAADAADPDGGLR